MIISASRRTDIPRFHFEWFLNRLDAGYVLARNPLHRSKVLRIPLDRKSVECIAFWTKNPRPLLDRIDALQYYPFFIQFTLNAYGKDVEAGLPAKADLIETFQRLAKRIGPERMIWRYSPILLSERYSFDHHLTYFERFAARLEGCTDTCRISFLDIYPKLTHLLAANGITGVAVEQETALAKSLVAIARNHGISIGGCGAMDLEAAEIARVGCIDARSVARATGNSLGSNTAASHRTGCYCSKSIDIGAYDTCAHGCLYCYANRAGRASSPVLLNQSDPHSPLLCDRIGPEDSITLHRPVAQTSPQLMLDLPASQDLI